MSNEELQQLFARTLSGDYDYDQSWDAVRELQHHGNQEIFDIAAEWCRSPNPLMRARGADVIGQIGKTAENPTNSFPKQAFSVISELVQAEAEIQPLSSGIFALGHLDDLCAVPLISKYAAHTAAEVRYAVACALGSYSNDSLAIATLV